MTWLAAEAAAGSTGMGAGFWIIYIAVIIGFMYLVVIRPQNKQKKQQAELMESMAVGDTCLTSSGFYGTIIDITEDVVIVEFGSNQNCRIPMQKSAVVQSEKPGQE